MHISQAQRRRDFSVWLRTGQWPPVRDPDGLERKFNPWHDPANGRFTFSGAGHFYGAGGAASTRPAGRNDPRNPPITTRPKAEAQRTQPPAKHGDGAGRRGASEGRTQAASQSRPGGRPGPVAEFAGGVGEGLYNVAEEAVGGVYSALTTNPATTVRNLGRGIAGMIDSAVAAEDTPARVQVARAAEAVAKASPRELGRATGSVLGNAALAAAPGAALSKVSAARRLRAARPRPTYDAPQVGWVKENLNSDEPWKKYKDSAAGARSGQAPTLMRTMPDGSKRPVKFDGVRGDFLIDRKWSVSGKPRAIGQILRQSEVLAQHRLIGTWEVPTQVARDAAIKILKMNVTNINVKVVKP